MCVTFRKAAFERLHCAHKNNDFSVGNVMLLWRQNHLRQRSTRCRMLNGSVLVNAGEKRSSYFKWILKIELYRLVAITQTLSFSEKIGKQIIPCE